MDNFSIYTHFVTQALKSKNKVKIHSMTQNHNKGVPNIVQQEELKNKYELFAIKGTVKVAVL